MGAGEPDAEMLAERAGVDNIALAFCMDRKYAGQPRTGGLDRYLVFGAVKVKIGRHQPPEHSMRVRV